MKISVVTPSYNQAPFLEACLRSVHEQSGDFDIEHIVVDGGSDDGSLEILQQWSSRIAYTSKPDRGQSHALNIGIERATGDVIAWLNSDDVLLAGALDTVARFFENNPEQRWMYGRCRIIDREGAEFRRAISLYKRLLMARFSLPVLLIENFISQPSTFFTKSLYEDVGGVDESLRFSMDYDLFLRFALVVDPGVVADELAAFRLYRDSKSGEFIDETLRVANAISRKYAERVGMPWMGELNYWLYYKRTSAIYRVLDRLER